MNIRQKKVFFNGEGDKFFLRNAKNLTDLDYLKKTDEIIKYFIASVPSVGKVLEIGYSNGWRLQILNEIYQCGCYGIDPSLEAMRYGETHYPKVKFVCATADSLSFPKETFDHVILGFCLYICDREYLFKIAYEVDRVLADKGMLYILDFCPPFPYRREYRHCQDVYSYKMDHSKLFLWNPFYTLVFQKKFTLLGAGNVHHMDYPELRMAVSVIQKYRENAYPPSPYHLPAKAKAAKRPGVFKHG